MYVSHVMRQQDHCNRLRDRAFIRFRFLAFQYTNTERNHSHDVKLETSDCAVSIFLIPNHRNVSVVKLTVSWTTLAIRINEGLELTIDPVRARRLFPAFPTLDFIRQCGRSLQRHAIEELSNFVCSRLIMCQSLVCDCSDKLMSAWSIAKTIN